MHREEALGWALCSKAKQCCARTSVEFCMCRNGAGDPLNLCFKQALPLRLNPSAGLQTQQLERGVCPALPSPTPLDPASPPHRPVRRKPCLPRPVTGLGPRDGVEGSNSQPEMLAETGEITSHAVSPKEGDKSLYRPSKKY